MTDLIVAEGKRIVSLLDKVEEFGHAGLPQLAPVNVHDLLDRARKSAKLGFGAAMNFFDDYDPSLPDVFADGDQLLQVFLNNLQSIIAWKKLSLRSSKSWMVLTVAVEPVGLAGGRDGVQVVESIICLFVPSIKGILYFFGTVVEVPNWV